jgi:hypothetical protein
MHGMKQLMIRHFHRWKDPKVFYAVISICFMILNANHQDISSKEKSIVVQSGAPPDPVRIKKGALIKPGLNPRMVG